MGLTSLPDPLSKMHVRASATQAASAQNATKSASTQTGDPYASNVCSKGSISSLLLHLGAMDWPEETVDFSLGLLDYGATRNTSSAKSIEGAIPESFRPADAGTLECGLPLEVKGSYLYSFRRSGVEGTELMLRRMLHVPELPVPVLFAWSDERRLGYRVVQPARRIQTIASAAGVALRLLPSASGLGWLVTEPIPDGPERIDLLIDHDMLQEPELVAHEHELLAHAQRLENLPSPEPLHESPNNGCDGV